MWSILPPVQVLNGKEDIKEEFLTFDPIINMHGLGYDGASNMSSGKVGVQAQIISQLCTQQWTHPMLRHQKVLHTTTSM